MRGRLHGVDRTLPLEGHLLVLDRLLAGGLPSPTHKYIFTVNLGGPVALAICSCWIECSLGVSPRPSTPTLDKYLFAVNLGGPVALDRLLAWGLPSPLYPNLGMGTSLPST